MKTIKALLQQNPYIINEKQCLPPFYRLPLPLQENLDPPSIIFEKSQPTLQIRGE